MATSLVDIPTACSSHGLVTVVGVVVDALDVFRTRGSSSCVTFTIKDSEFDAPTWQGGLKVKYFNDKESFLPQVRLNDVVLLRKIRVRMYQGKPTGVASQYDTVPWAVFRPEADPSSSQTINSGPEPFKPTATETRAALKLLDCVSEQSNSVPPPQKSKTFVVQASKTPVTATPDGHIAARSTGVRPFTLIKDAQRNTITQLLGQVVTMNTYDSEKTILQITDYTSNALLIDYKNNNDEGPEGGFIQPFWPGPWGQMVMQVTLWEPHAGYARENVKVGDIVLLTYVHIKMRRASDILEAVVHEDKRYNEKIHVRLYQDGHDERTQELMRRRKEYWEVHGQPSKKPEKANKRKAKEEQKQQQQQKKRKEKEAQLTECLTDSETIVAASGYQIPAKSLEYILSRESHRNALPGDLTYKLPFQNVCYRPLVRVVDFFPPNIEDFAVAVPNNSILEETSGAHSNSTYNGRPHMTWDWRFCLLVEAGESNTSKNQPREYMKIFVSGADGVHLLCLDPTDLRRNKKGLAELKERLFILWGDLLEKKQQAAAASTNNQAWAPFPSVSLPFICCIKEYGVRCSHQTDPDAVAVDGEVCSQPDCFGWERRFAMFGTTIRS
ncbi:hypothetical protein N7474_007906 [Penicillium riverlandense]|uniref:uncharacterized protein n=1 Tax=Penicillium riverlandense TaxID=1903569 RepID=UPI002547C8CF|nr:uncharacterized protein N7474_007906 [Penicillium riverlandense]KAJ5811605.1 hypothetical protein N7474_007906 [Penicillium riverlandense]